ncbi:MAG TPA: hypothetical protein VFB01_15845 [Burkholderiales bacterium]|nr:hypothetical protein [Burkholderiales bacterium]
MADSDPFKFEDHPPGSPAARHGATREAVETWEGEGGTAAAPRRVRAGIPAKKPGRDPRRKVGKRE